MSRVYANKTLLTKTGMEARLGTEAMCNLSIPSLNKLERNSSHPEKNLSVRERNRLRTGSYCVLLLTDDTYKIEDKISSAS